MFAVRARTSVASIGLETTSVAPCISASTHTARSPLAVIIMIGTSRSSGSLRTDAIRAVPVSVGIW